MASKLTDNERSLIRNQMVAKPLETADLVKVVEAIQRLHASLLHVGDVTRPWSYQNRARSDALVVIGGYRFGKTTSVRTAISRLKPLATPDGSYLAPKPIEIKAPNTFGIETLAREILDTMSLCPARSIGPSMTTQRLHTRLVLRQPTIIHIDEAQRMLSPDRVSAHRLPGEQKKIFSQIRDLMDLDKAPMPIVLSGTRELIPVMEREDLGFFRETKNIIVLEPMKVGKQEDRDCLDDALELFSGAVGMKADILPKDFFDRLIHASNCARGLAFEICQEAILNAATEGRKTVGIEDFEAFYARKAGCYRAANPFAATDWPRIEPNALMAVMSGPKAPKIGDPIK